MWIKQWKHMLNEWIYLLHPLYPNISPLHGKQIPMFGACNYNFIVFCALNIQTSFRWIIPPLFVVGNSWKFPKKTWLSLFVPRYAKVSLTKCRGHVDFADVHQNTGAHGDPEAQISGLSVEPVVPRVEFRFRCTIWLWLAVCHGKSTHLS